MNLKNLNAMICASVLNGEGMNMKSVGYYKSLPIQDLASLQDLSIPEPTLALPHDIKVRVKAVSVNPVDTKQRKRAEAPDGQATVLGYDATGIIEAVGSEVKHLRVGDEVYYAGSILRAGSNAELQLVDSRLVSPKPKSLDFAQAAAIPLTALTAYEGLFEQMGIRWDKPERNAQKTLLVIGGAGGVGSMLIQMAKIAGLRVVATASRDNTREWIKKLGADEVINHREALAPQLQSLDIKEVDYIFNTANTAAYWDQMADLIKPFGKITSIVESPTPVDITKLMRKSASFSWELMFTRSLYATDDMSRQSEILNQVAQWVDEGKLISTATQILSPINAQNMRQAHELLESGQGIGKIVLSEW